MRQFQQVLAAAATTLFLASPSFARQTALPTSLSCGGIFRALEPANDGDHATASASRRQNLARAIEATAPLAKSQLLKVTTLNANKINKTRLSNPAYLDGRPRFDYEIRAHLHGSEAPDALLLQEIWEDVDHGDIASMARELGYAPIANDWNFVKRTGLQILLREPLASNATESGFFEFKKSGDRPENAFWERSEQVRRGVLFTIVNFPDGQRGLIGTVHGTPLELHASVRERQMALLKSFLQSKAVDFAVLGGDYNMPADSAASASPWQRRFQARGRSLYDSLFQTTGLVDAYRAAVPAEVNPGYTTNPGVLHALPLRILGRLGLPIQSERIDMIFVWENGSLVHVEQAGVLFDQPTRLPGETDGKYFTDHFGVGAKLHAFQPLR